MSDRAPVDIATMLGGRRGIVDATTPGVVLVLVDAFAPLGWAIAAAVVTTAALGILRLVRGEPVRQALMSIGGIAAAAALAAFTGSAKTYFLPGILLNAGYAVAAVLSIAIGRPLLAYAAALLDRDYAHWREDARLRRAATAATAVWGVVFALRAVVQGYLYTYGKDSWLAPARLGMGLPLSALAFAITLLLLEGHRRDGKGSVDAPAP